MVSSIQNQPSGKPLIVLSDTGADSSWLKFKALPPGAIPKKGRAVSSSALAGNVESNLSAELQGIVFPDFFKTRRIDRWPVKVFKAECRYDAIIGRDLLQELGLVIDFKNGKMTWDDCHVPMRPFPQVNTKKGIEDPTPAEQLFLDALEADLEDDDTLPACDLTDDEDDLSLNDDYNSDEGNDHAMDVDEDIGEGVCESEKRLRSQDVIMWRLIKLLGLALISLKTNRMT